VGGEPLRPSETFHVDEAAFLLARDPHSGRRIGRRILVEFYDAWYDREGAPLPPAPELGWRPNEPIGEDIYALYSPIQRPEANDGRLVADRTPMIDLTAEKAIPLSRAARLVPSATGEGTVHPSTIHRWVVRGHRGIKLEALRLGGRWVTSAEAVARFAERLTAAYTGESSGTPTPPDLALVAAPTTPTPTPKSKSAALATAALDAAGW
jgi:hypothetical protein